MTCLFGSYVYSLLLSCLPSLIRLYAWVRDRLLTCIEKLANLAYEYCSIYNYCCCALIASFVCKCTLSCRLLSMSFVAMSFLVITDCFEAVFLLSGLLYGWRSDCCIWLLLVYQQTRIVFDSRADCLAVYLVIVLCVVFTRRVVLCVRVGFDF